MGEAFPNSEKLKILIAALERYQANYNTSAYSTMGFWLLGLGWLLTSTNTRDIIGDQKYLPEAAIAFIWINWVLFSYASYRLFVVANTLYQRLENWPYAKGSFEHAKMPYASLIVYCSIIGLIVILITLVLINLLPSDGITN